MNLNNSTINSSLNTSGYTADYSNSMNSTVRSELTNHSNKNSLDFNSTTESLDVIELVEEEEEPKIKKKKSLTSKEAFERVNNSVNNSTVQNSNVKDVKSPPLKGGDHNIVGGASEVGGKGVEKQAKSKNVHSKEGATAVLEESNIEKQLPDIEDDSPSESTSEDDDDDIPMVRLSQENITKKETRESVEYSSSQKPLINGLIEKQDDVLSEGSRDKKKEIADLSPVVRNSIKKSSSKEEVSPAVSDIVDDQLEYAERESKRSSSKGSLRKNSRSPESNKNQDKKKETAAVISAPTNLLSTIESNEDDGNNFNSTFKSTLAEAPIMLDIEDSSDSEDSDSDGEGNGNNFNKKNENTSPGLSSGNKAKEEEVVDDGGNSSDGEIERFQEPSPVDTKPNKVISPTPLVLKKEEEIPSVKVPTPTKKKDEEISQFSPPPPVAAVGKPTIPEADKPPPVVENTAVENKNPISKISTSSSDEGGNNKKSSKPSRPKAKPDLLAAFQMGVDATESGQKEASKPPVNSGESNEGGGDFEFSDIGKPHQGGADNSNLDSATVPIPESKEEEVVKRQPVSVISTSLMSLEDDDELDIANLDAVLNKNNNSHSIRKQYNSTDNNDSNRTVGMSSLLGKKTNSKDKITGPSSEFAIQSKQMSGKNSKFISKPDTFDEAVKMRINKKNSTTSGGMALAKGKAKPKKISSKEILNKDNQVVDPKITSNAPGSRGVAAQSVFSQYKTPSTEPNMYERAKQRIEERANSKEGSDKAASSPTTAQANLNNNNNNETKTFDNINKNADNEEVGVTVISAKNKSIDEIEDDERQMWDALEIEGTNNNSNTIDLGAPPPSVPTKTIGVQPKNEQSNISYNEFLLDYFVKMPNDVIEEEPVRSGGCCSGGGGSSSSNLRPEFDEERAKLRKLVRTKYDPNNETHFRIIATLFKKLTKSKNHYVLSIGSHWEAIGLQGTNPETDLNRSGGVCNLVHVLHFLSTPPTNCVGLSSDCASVCERLHQISQDEYQHFPFLCMSIGYSKLALDIFSEGEYSEYKSARAKLMKIINKNNSGPHPVMNGVCKFQNAMLFAFYEKWRHEKRTINDYSRTMKEIEAIAKKNPQSLLDAFDEHFLNIKKEREGVGLEFTDLDQAQASARQSAQQKADKKAQDERLKKYAT